MPSARKPPPTRRPKLTSGLAITSLILSVFGVCSGITAVAGVICGHLGLAKIRRSNGEVQGAGLAIAGLVIGYLAILGWVAWGVLLYQAATTVADAAEEAKRQSSEPFVFAEVPIPVFPGLPSMEPLGDTGVTVGQVEWKSSGGGPGGEMSLRIYLPAGEHEPGSLPLVLTAPAGTNLLSGSEIGPLDEDGYHDESLPYAEAGMAVILYSIDGAVEDEEDYESLGAAYDEFRAASAGVVNGRNALEYALARLPMVDPDRIFSAGHSSAATLALLMSVHEPRLAGAVAYAPAIDLEDHFAELLAEPVVKLVYSDLDHFVRRSSPLTHADRVKGPLFLFFAEDDGMASPQAARDLASRIESQGGDVTLELVPRGGHYQSMINEGIPAGIDWMKGLP